MQEEDEDGATNDGLCGSKTAKTTEKTECTTSCKLLMSNLFKLSFLMADNTEVLDSFLYTYENAEHIYIYILMYV